MFEVNEMSLLYRGTVLVDNHVLSAREDLEAEHGLSMYIETPDSSFLFDCGHTGMAWNNAKALGVDLSAVKDVILSHSHYDHAGGFPALLKYCQPEAVYTGINFWQEKYSYDKENNEYLYKGCGFTKKDLEAWGIEQRVCRSIIPLDDYANIVTGFDKHYDFETIPEKFVRGENKEPDPFDDEICLLLPEGDGLAMVVGCSHVGILNMVATVKERTEQPVYSVMGGIHLSGGEERINETMRELERLGVENFNLCHCSGINNMATGSVIEVQCQD